MCATPKSSRSIGSLIGESYRLITRDFNERARAHGLTQTQWQALAALSNRQGIKQAELAELLQVQPISLARLIDRMEASGWIQRRPDPKDRRAIQLFLTDKVEPILDEMASAAAQTREAALAGMDDSERQQLHDLLDRITNNFREPEIAAAATRTTSQEKPSNEQQVHAQAKRKSR